MARVADEAAHLPQCGLAVGERRVDGAEHCVDRCRQLADLGARIAGREALAEITGGDRLRGCLDLAEGPEGPRHEQARRDDPRDDRRDREQAVDDEEGA